MHASASAGLAARPLHDLDQPPGGVQFLRLAALQEQELSHAHDPADTMSAAADTAALTRHRWYEDIQALVIGTLFVALGVVMFGTAGLLTGGTAGIAFLIHYATGVSFSLAFFVINLPFYVFAWKRMGKAFTAKTFAVKAWSRCSRISCRRACILIFCRLPWRRCWAGCCAAPAC